jgi:hypothetical protein
LTTMANSSGNGQSTQAWWHDRKWGCRCNSWLPILTIIPLNSEVLVSG